MILERSALAALFQTNKTKQPKPTDDTLHRAPLSAATAVGADLHGRWQLHKTSEAQLVDVLSSQVLQRPLPGTTSKGRKAIIHQHTYPARLRTADSRKLYGEA